MESKTRPALLHRVEVEKYIDPEAEWQTGFWLQYTTLTRRNFWSQRPRYFSKLHYGQKLFIGVIIGLVWFNLSRTEDTARDRLGVVRIPLFISFHIYTSNHKKDAPFIIANNFVYCRPIIYIWQLHIVGNLQQDNLGIIRPPNTVCVTVCNSI